MIMVFDCGFSRGKELLSGDIMGGVEFRKGVNGEQI